MLPERKFLESEDPDGFALQLAQASLDAAREPLFRVRADGRFDFVNDAACRSLGYSRDELSALTLSDIDVDFPPQKLAGFWVALRDAGALDVEGRHRHKDGGVIPVALNIRLLELDGEDFALVSARDISAEKEARRVLGQSEARLRSARRHAGIGYAEGAFESGDLVWDEDTFRIFGYEPGSITPTSDLVSQHIVPEDRQAFEAAKRHYLEGTDSGYKFEYRIVAADGERRHIREEIAITRDDNDEVLFTTALVHDITKAKLAEASLRESEARLREAQRLARMGEWHRDLVNNRLTYSDQIFEILGVTRKNFTPSPEALTELIHPDDRDYFLNFANNRTYEPEPFSYSHRIVRPDGGVIHVEQRSTPILDDAGIVIARRGTMQDITPLKQTTLALQESEAEFSQAQAIAHVGSWYRDLVKGELTYSDEMFRILGVEREGFAVLPESFMAMVHPDDH